MAQPQQQQNIPDPKLEEIIKQQAQDRRNG